MSRSHIPVICKEDLEELLGGVAEELSSRQGALDDSISAQLSHLFLTAKVELLQNISVQIDELKTFKVKKNDLHDDDGNYWGSADGDL